MNIGLLTLEKEESARLWYQNREDQIAERFAAAARRKNKIQKLLTC
jgi:hypothetical protein